MPAGQVLLVDVAREQTETLAENVRTSGHICTVVHELPEALDELRDGSFHLVILDLADRNAQSGPEVLSMLAETQRDAKVITLIDKGDVAACKSLMPYGAEIVEKPYDDHTIGHLIRAAVHDVISQGQTTDGDLVSDGIVAESDVMAALLAQMLRVAREDMPVLVTGDTGTGKGLIARAVHLHSRRAAHQLVEYSCVGIECSPADLRAKLPERGTMLLDKVDELPAIAQGEVLRLLETGALADISTSDRTRPGARLVSATSQDLKQLVEEGIFRRDLYFHIKGVELPLPSLSDRRDDILPLVQYYAAQFAERPDAQEPRITQPVQEALESAEWPGNVRQLVSTVQVMMLNAVSSPVQLCHLPADISQAEPIYDGGMERLSHLDLQHVEKRVIRVALHRTGGNREQAALMLGIGERTLYRKLREYNLR